MSATLHPAAPHHLPAFITAPGDTDVLMVTMAVVLAMAVLGFGILFFRLHSLPERMAHKTKKLQFELVAVLCLISLFTHMHIFWIAGLLLALVDLPDFGTPLGRIAGSVEKIAGVGPSGGEATQMDQSARNIQYELDMQEPNEADGATDIKPREKVPLMTPRPELARARKRG